MKTVSPAEFFETIARRYDRVYALDAEMTRARMKRLLPLFPPPPARVLDLGVGTGRELGALQDAGYDVTGLDVSSAMLVLCGRRARPAPLVLADLWAPLPFADASFDAVISLHGTLVHPPDRAAYKRLAGELARVLRADGVFLAEVPARDWVRRLAAAGIEEGDARVVRIADDRLLHEDRAAGMAIEAIVPSEAEWQEAFAEGFDVECEALGEAETLVVGRRRGA
ncbi:MAG: class I SAM-dependent methyltransferase [Polyangiaceae bacterium]